MPRESIVDRLRLVKRFIDEGKRRNAKWNVDELIKEIVGEEDEKKAD